MKVKAERNKEKGKSEGQELRFKSRIRVLPSPFANIASDFINILLAEHPNIQIS
jgi:hypothetical protein